MHRGRSTARRTHCRRRGLAIAVVLVLAACTPSPQLSIRFPGRAPALPGLIPTPDPLPPGAPGTVVASETVEANPALPGVTAHRILYRSTDAAGATIAVSGYVVIPAGTPPAGGWPVLTWAHGTVGLSDGCAPSIHPDRWLYGTTSPEQVTSLVARGVMVVATDYQGLGTDGPHPYLDGPSEGRAVLDAARAAAAFGGSNRVAIEGFSQGGHAALFAGRLAPTYATDLDVVGTLAIAPSSNLNLAAILLPIFGHNTIVVVMMGYGLLAVNPSFNAGDVFTPDAVEALSNLDDSTCGYPAFTEWPFVRDRPAPQSWTSALAANEPGAERIAGPVVLVQGSTDIDVPAVATDGVCSELGANGTDAWLVTYDGQDHIGSVVASSSDRATWILERLAGSPTSLPQHGSARAC